MQRCPGPLAEARAEEEDVLACRRCVLIEEMCHHIEVSLEEVSWCAPSGKMKKQLKDLQRCLREESFNSQLHRGDAARNCLILG